MLLQWFKGPEGLLWQALSCHCITAVAAQVKLLEQESRDLPCLIHLSAGLPNH